MSDIYTIHNDNNNNNDNSNTATDNNDYIYNSSCNNSISFINALSIKILLFTFFLVWIYSSYVSK